MNDSTLDDSFAAGASATSMQMTRGSLVVALQREFEEQWLLRLQRDLLDTIQRSGVRRIVLDATAVETMDSVDFRVLRQTLDMVGLMGAVAVVVGLGPGIVSALVTMDVDVSGLRAPQPKSGPIRWKAHTWWNRFASSLKGMWRGRRFELLGSVKRSASMPPLAPCLPPRFQSLLEISSSMPGKVR
jgi:rsbT antagonist protein RsbS